MQWLVDLIIEMIGIPPTYIDRGDPTVADFTEVQFIEDNAWHDLNLSAIVPAGATAVAISLYLNNAAVQKSSSFRKTGNVNTINIAIAITQVANITFWADLICPCDENRHIEYKFTAGGWNNIIFTVKGWWL